MAALPPGFGPFLLDVARVPATENSLPSILKAHGIASRGVVHVGAHYGQELEIYLACGFDPIVLVEANPAVFSRLTRHVTFWTDWLTLLEQRYGIARPPRIIAVNAAASDRQGHAAFYVAEHDPQSSLLPPNDPRIRSRGAIEVESTTLDRLLARRSIPTSAIGMLSIDAQGAEALVLAGAGDLLAKVDLLLTEVNYEPRYKRCARPDEIDRIASDAGLEELLRSTPLPDYPVVDVLYKRGASAST